MSGGITPYVSKNYEKEKPVGLSCLKMDLTQQFSCHNFHISTWCGYMCLSVLASTLLYMQSVLNKNIVLDWPG